MRIILFVYFSIFITTSKAFIPNLIDFFEKQIIHRTVENCTKGQIITSTEYEDLKNIARLKMNAVVWTHYVNGGEVKYSLPSVLEGIKSSKTYDKSKPLTLIIHGYFGNVGTIGLPSKQIINELRILNNTNLFFMDHNVLMVDSYYASATNARIIGEALGEILANLYKSGFSNFHLIGHSLGAHASGFAGKIFTAITGKKINRISGLDPAGPCYFVQPADKRLTSSDADFVDVIHSDMYTLGINTSLGHIDFYPNSGENMAGCITSYCSHNTSPKYFAESVRNNNFLAVSCANWNTFKSGACTTNDQKPMGYWTPTSARGNYYLKTNWISKFALGANGIKP